MIYKISKTLRLTEEWDDDKFKDSEQKQEFENFLNRRRVKLSKFCGTEITPKAEWELVQDSTCWMWDIEVEHAIINKCLYYRENNEKFFIKQAFQPLNPEKMPGLICQCGNDSFRIFHGDDSVIAECNNCNVRGEIFSS